MGLVYSVRLNIDIPDNGGRVLVVRGRELMAFTRPADDPGYLYVKETPCNLCGKCCMEHPPAPHGCDENGWCVKLREDRGTYICTLGTMMPLNCLQDPVDFEECCITHRKVKIG